MTLNVVIRRVVCLWFDLPVIRGVPRLLTGHHGIGGATLWVSWESGSSSLTLLPCPLCLKFDCSFCHVSHDYKVWRNACAHTCTIDIRSIYVERLATWARACTKHIGDVTSAYRIRVTQSHSRSQWLRSCPLERPHTRESTAATYLRGLSRSRAVCFLSSLPVFSITTSLDWVILQEELLFSSPKCTGTF